MISLEVQKICLQKGDLNNMEKRKDIDMLRFYGGDIHQKNKEGEYVITNNLVNPKNKEDVLSYRKLSTDECVKELIKFNGVGPKVADCIALFGMQKYDTFLVV